MIFKNILNFLVNSQDVCASEGAFCGGIRGVQCCANQLLTCHLDGDFPDAGGKCVKNPIRACRAAGQMCGGLAGFMCCEGLKCDAPKTCCDMSGKCIPA